MICNKCGCDLRDGAVFCDRCGKKQVTERSRRSRPNGTGSIYKRGKTWEIAVVMGYKLVDGKAVPIRKTKGGFRTKKEAMEYVPELRHEKVRRVPTVQNLMDQFRAAGYKKLSKSKRDAYEIAWRKMDDIYHCRIDQLTTADLQALVNEKAPTYYPARDIKNLLSKLYQQAMADQFVTTNLSDFLVLPDLEAKEKEAFSAEEIVKLWEDYGNNWWTGYILLMCYSGMMPGELLEARKCNVDLDNKRICGAGKKTKVRKETPIVLADAIVPVVAELCEHTPGDKLIRINKDNFYERYYETLERAGCRRLTPYSCRHTAATALALENIPPSVIQKVMRHAKFSTTQQYIHVDVSAMQAAVNRLGAVGSA